MVETISLFGHVGGFVIHINIPVGSRAEELGHRCLYRGRQ